MNSMLQGGVRAAESGALSRPGLHAAALSSLRTFLTLLVVAHHAALAYHPYAPPLPASIAVGPAIWLAFPIVDAQKWPRADLFVGWNDVFFMSLMFFVAGAVAWPSLARRGAAAFARERALRLGVPFVISAVLLAPLAYYATYVATGADPSPIAFARTWLGLGIYPAGPAWFIWVLLAFGFVAAALSVAAPRWGDALGAVTGRLSARPIVYALALVAVSALAYVPMALAFTAERWSMVGPFTWQTSRLLHYAVYFLAGIGVGAYGLDRGLLASDGRLARRWPLWALAAFIAFAIGIVVLLVILSTLSKGGPGTGLLVVGHLSFVLTCATSSLAVLALFVRYGSGTTTRESRGAWASLGANAYGVYLLHYVTVAWLQLALLGTMWPGSLKTLAVFAGAVAICWTVTATLRRIPLVARVI
jgi:peptidoglycan/LPS O-acetylase OafA/YrhL